MDLGILKQINYDIYSNKDRVKLAKQIVSPQIEQICAEHLDNEQVQKQLEALGNYILYGKNPDNDLNVVQDKTIQIQSKFSTFKRKEPESLEGLLEGENPTPESAFHEIKRNIYTNPKATISREDDKDLPGIQDLWIVIDKLAEEVQKLKDEGKRGIEFYRKNHLLIQLRQQQYTIKEQVKPTFRANNSNSETRLFGTFTSDTGYVKETADPANWEWIEVSENLIDFSNPEHIYHFVENYADLKKYCWEELWCDLRYLIYEFEDLVDNCPLSAEKKYILLKKIEKQTNSQIREYLYGTFGCTYNENYISTIFTKNICKEMAQFYQLKLDEFKFKDEKDKWKVCSTCGQSKLKDNRSFVVNLSTKDGFSARCKECNKSARNGKTITLRGKK